MKRLPILSLLTVAALAAATGYMILKDKPQTAAASPAPPPAEPEIAPEPEALKTDVRKAVSALPEPAPAPEPAKPVVVKAKPIEPPKKTVTKPAVKKLSPEEQRRIAIERYYRNMEQNFQRKLRQLEGEQNPARRDNLIKAIARYVRIDTPKAIEWAMGLTNPEEQRLALEAINQNALTGIGARIEVDGTGFPKIKETTVMSAIQSTGLVEPGDYIIGIENPDEAPVYFEGLSIQQIVQMLRGKAGSEVRLLMERVVDNSGSVQGFHVPVQRSLIVMQPPR